MKVGIFRISSAIDPLTSYESAVIEYLDKNNNEIFIDINSFKNLLGGKNDLPIDINKIDVWFTIGGDGTLLIAIPLI